MRQMVPLFVAFLLCSRGLAGELDRPPSGWCSAALAAAPPRATVFCSDVAAAALSRLNELLDSSQLTFAQRLAHAGQWARQYRDFKQRLHLLNLAAERLAEEGRFEEAGALLEHTLRSGRLTQRERTEYGFAVARSFSLQLRPVEALPFYESAARESPDVFVYAFSYAEALRQEHRTDHARSAYQHALFIVPRDPLSPPPAMAMTLTALATLARDNGQVREAEQTYRQALQIYYDLRDERYAADTAAVLNHLGVLYHRTSQTGEAELAYQEALGVYRSLAQANAAAYLPDVAGVLHNLTLFYRGSERRAEEQWALYGELDVYRKLVADGYPAYLPDLANALNNLGVLYHTGGRASQAESAYREALALYRAVVEYDPAHSLGDLAGVLNNLGVVYRDTQRTSEARQALGEASRIRSTLASRQPRVYTVDLVQTLANLQKVYRQIGWNYEAREISERLEKLGAVP